MKESDALAEAAKIFEEKDFVVERIPQSKVKGKRRPDLAVRFGSELYLIEQKSKGDNPAEREQEHKDLQGTKIIDRAKKLQPRSTLSGILRDAIDQIDAHPDSGYAFKIVWITTWGVWSHANSDSLFKGVYGSQHVFDTEDHGGEMKDCYYLGFSDFERYSEIDAVVIIDGSYLQILANEFSPRFESFLESELANRFKGGVHFPEKVVEAGDAYSLRDYDGDRKDQEACLTELANRLGTKRMMVIPMSEFHVVANIDGYPKSKQGDTP